MSKPDFSLETALYAEGKCRIAGIDEVGRGALAGPVTVAAVILDPEHLPHGLDDSKKLTAKQREALFTIICRDACAISIAYGSAKDIDRVNVRQSTLAAMARAAFALALQPDHILIDGRDIPHGLNICASAIIKGDSRSMSIAAASIVAKVMRDRLMAQLDPHNLYGFAHHVGYGTAFHLAALKKYGAGPYHRSSFAPIRSSRQTKLTPY